MKVRRLRVGDEELAASIVNAVRLEEDVQWQVMDAALMDGFLANESNYLVAAYDDDGTPAGFVLGYRLNRMDSIKNMMYVHEVSVVENRRRQGVGKAIMGEMIRICRAEGFVKMFLGTDKDNLPANRLYSTTGGIPGGGNAVGYWWNFEIT